MGIIVANGKGRFIDVNPKAEHLLGYDRETLVTLGVDEIAPPEDLDEIREDYGRLIATGQLEGEYRMTAKDGSMVPFYPVDTGKYTFRVKKNQGWFARKIEFKD